MFQQEVGKVIGVWKRMNDVLRLVTGRVGAREPLNGFDWLRLLKADNGKVTIESSNLSKSTLEGVEVRKKLVTQYLCSVCKV
jgi:hypothetical protein